MPHTVQLLSIRIGVTAREHGSQVFFLGLLGCIKAFCLEKKSWFVKLQWFYSEATLFFTYIYIYMYIREGAFLTVLLVVSVHTWFCQSHI